MKVSELLETRWANWRELDRLCTVLEGRWAKTVRAEMVTRMAALYRGACADLALADAYQLPPGTIDYLHRLVGKAHNQLYRSRRFAYGSWLEELLVAVPQRLFHDNCLRLAFCIFWGMFLLAAGLAYHQPAFAERVWSKDMLMEYDEMYSRPPEERGINGMMVGLYIWINPAIGLQCFAGGLLLGVGGLFVTASNASLLGAMFGYFARSPHRENFFHFVTAHGPLELTAVVLSAAAGMRLGFSLIDTKGLTRSASLRAAAGESLPVALAAMLMFFLAAMIEAFLSPSAAPYPVKVAVAAVSAGALAFYFVILGYPRSADAGWASARQPDPSDSSQPLQSRQRIEKAG
jgi:uncharacterized membrane protein SpoIIM required for sporulation